MKNSQKYLLSASIAVLVVSLVSVGAASFAQTTTPVSCSVLGSSSVAINTTQTLLAMGGNGTYVWSGTGLNVSNPSGAEFMVSYPTTGTYAVNVTSAGETATCNVVVATPGATAGLSCFPATQTVVLGDTATLSADGGNGTFAWSSPDLTITNPNGSGFNANFATIGNHILTVTSNGLSATCAVTVTDPGTVPVVTPTPGLPATGGGYGQPR